MRLLKGVSIYTYILFVSIILIIPALFINLGLDQLINDEGIRALVALEMKFRGEYFTPTIAGELYFKKPPLYNWILLLFFNLSGNYSEFMIRLPNVISLLGYSLSIFFIVRKKYSLKIGFLSAILFIVSGRVLFYESLVGLIDITYSWLIFLNFIFIFDLFHKQKFLKLFLLSYLITGITLLMKGLPSLAFQWITFLVIFVSNKQFKRLFSWNHFVGFLPFLVITGGYYFTYYLKNPENIYELLNTIVHESTDKSAISFGIWDIIKHIFSFSFETLYAFVPGTFVFLFFLRKKSFEWFKKDPFLKYISLVFIFNIPIYLVSPVSYLRYLLMLMPLLFIVFAVLYEENRGGNTFLFKLLDTIFILFGAVMSIIYLAAPIIKETDFVSNAWLKAGILSAISIGVFILLGFKYKLRLEMLVILLLITRIGFNLFILPSRVHNDWEIKERDKIIEIGKVTKGERVFIYDYAFINYRSLYYLTLGRMESTEKTMVMKEKGYYLVEDFENRFTDKTLYQFSVMEPGRVLSVVKVE